MRILKAAQMMEAAYLAPHKLRHRAHPLKKEGVEAYFTTDRTVIVVGTNQISDWIRYNLQISVRPPQISELLTRRGASGAIWHGGFLRHAEIVYEWAKPLKPRLFIGHSLGAAAVQIVGASLRVPTIAFASPQPKATRSKFSGEGVVLNICRSDDLVTRVPPTFRRVGHTRMLTPPKPKPGMDHKMKFYIQLIKDPRARGSLPSRWPR